jgi:hypothetical protein
LGDEKPTTWRKAKENIQENIQEIILVNYKEIIWLASYPKSGNTWVRLFIEVYLLGKFELNNILCSVSDDTSTRHGVGDGSDERSFPIDIQQLTRPMALLRLVKMFHKHKPVESMPLFVKTHNANLIANGITLLPEQLSKKTVHIVRDPRDVVLSFSKHVALSIDETIDYMEDKYQVLNNSESNVLKMSDFLSSWRKHTQSFLEGDLIGVKTFLYEDMLYDGVKTFCDILDHCEIEPDVGRVEMAVEMVALSNLRDKEKEEGFLEASPKNKAGFFGKGGSRWRDELMPSQAHRIKKMAGIYMKKLGYLENKAA